MRESNAPLPFGQPVWPVQKTRLLSVLQNGALRESQTTGSIRWSSNSTYLVSISDEDITCPAIYKPQRGERPLWDFPDGTLCYREYAAFIISEGLAWDIVPPTVLRDGPRGLGSMQLYIPHNTDFNYFSLDAAYAPQLQRITAFDYVINNADRKGGHCLVDDNNHVWGIDHGIGFHSAPKLRTVIWDFAGQPIPEAILKDLENLFCQIEDKTSTLALCMAELLDHTEVNAFMARLRKLLQRREYPRPGPGPNYPWPPV
jgi:Phosphatidylinositol 3- and 4-kinase